MKMEDILSNCIEDRKKAFCSINAGFMKNSCIDLLVKYVILLINSIGKKSDKNCLLFVDEVNNQNMSDNLFLTYKKGSECGHNAKYLSFFSFQKREMHYKMGLIYPLSMLFRTCGILFLAGIRILCKRDTAQWICRRMIRIFNDYLAHIKNCGCFYLMTDHNFFSTVIAMNENCYSRVVQHGLVLYKDLYYPVRANQFCAWGAHTKEIMNNDEKVWVTGTYKFDSLEKRKNNASIRKVLYCVSTLDNHLVEQKIGILQEICAVFKMELAIKLHPGSFYSLDYWKNRFESIQFYKNERFHQIEFDLAVSENSTVNLDLSIMGKPFIIYDNNLGYFERYSEIIPFASNPDDLRRIFSTLDRFDFSEINKLLLQGELNGGDCSIF